MLSFHPVHVNVPSMVRLPSSCRLSSRPQLRCRGYSALCQRDQRQKTNTRDFRPVPRPLDNPSANWMDVRWFGVRTLLTLPSPRNGPSVDHGSLCPLAVTCMFTALCLGLPDCTTRRRPRHGNCGDCGLRLVVDGQRIVGKIGRLLVLAKSGTLRIRTRHRQVESLAIDQQLALLGNLLCLDLLRLYLFSEILTPPSF